MRRRSTGPDAATRDAVIGRAHGRCERCGDADGPFAIHHRLPRGRGGDNRISNLVLLDDECHRTVESRRTEAYEDGWLVFTGIDPATVPLAHHRNGWCCLTDDGSFGPVLEFHE